MVSMQDIPFGRREVLPLLGLQLGAPKGDDFYEHGWCRPAAVWLDDGTKRTERKVEAPLLIAMHTPDEPQDGPLSLEFWFDHRGEEIAVRVPWASFSTQRLGAALGTERDVVLALCNPQRKCVEVPACLGERTLHYAHGDVTAWLDDPRGSSPRIRLTATHWNTAHAHRL